MADGCMCQVLALLVLDTEGDRIAAKYSTVGRKETWPDFKAQRAFEKKIIDKLPKTCLSDVDVALVQDFTVLFQSCNDVVVCLVTGPGENEVLAMGLIEGIYQSIHALMSGASSFLQGGITKQAALQSLAQVYFILDEAIDDGVIMEVEEEKISARIKMIDETEIARAAEKSAQADQAFQKATQSAKSTLLGSLLGGRRS